MDSSLVPLLSQNTGLILENFRHEETVNILSKIIVKRIEEDDNFIESIEDDNFIEDFLQDCLNDDHFDTLEKFENAEKFINKVVSLLKLTSSVSHPFMKFTKGCLLYWFKESGYSTKDDDVKILYKATLIRTVMIIFTDSLLTNIGKGLIDSSDSIYITKTRKEFDEKVTRESSSIENFSSDIYEEFIQYLQRNNMITFSQDRSIMN